MESISHGQAVAIVTTWKSVGKNIANLPRYERTSEGIITLLPDYQRNQWHQFGRAFQSYQEALKAFGEILDSV
jgi:hypothetical protein